MKIDPLTQIEMIVILRIEPAFITFIKINRNMNEDSKNGNLGSKIKTNKPSIKIPNSILWTSFDLINSPNHCLTARTFALIPTFFKLLTNNNTEHNINILPRNNVRSPGDEYSGPPTSP